MVFLVLDPRAAVETIERAQMNGDAVWVGADALTQEEFVTFIKGGANITRFSHPLGNANSAVVAIALSTIEEHHPSETIWVQHVPQS